MTKKGTRLPEDWEPSESDFQYGLDLGVPSAEIGMQAKAFVNYWVAKAGKDATKLSWSRTWQNWIAKHADSKGHKPKAAPKPDGYPIHETRQSWKSAGSQVRSAFEAMRQHGAKDDALDDFYTQGVGLTTRFELPTFVVQNERACQIFHRALSYSAGQAGLNKVLYTKGWIAFRQENRQLDEEGFIIDRSSPERVEETGLARLHRREEIRAEARTA